MSVYFRAYTNDATLPPIGSTSGFYVNCTSLLLGSPSTPSVPKTLGGTSFHGSPRGPTRPSTPQSLLNISSGVPLDSHFAVVLPDKGQQMLQPPRSFTPTPRTDSRLCISASLSSTRAATMSKRSRATYEIISPVNDRSYIAMCFLVWVAPIHPPAASPIVRNFHFSSRVNHLGPQVSNSGRGAFDCIY